MGLYKKITDKENDEINEKMKSLEDYVKEKGPLELEELYTITLKVCETFERMHKDDICKKKLQLKPSNIILVKNEKVTLNIKNILETNKDFLSIGMIMYFMATGKRPFTLLEPIFDENYGVNSDFDLKRVIRKCFEYEAKNQYVSITELKKDISIMILRESVYKETKSLYAINTEEGSKYSRRVKKSKRSKEKFKTIGLPTTIAIALRRLQYVIKKSKNKLIFR